MSAASQTHNHPAIIGPWRLGRTLGRGATGRVLLGVHQTTGQKAAVKVVSKSDLNEEYEQPSDKKGGLPYGIEREIIIMKLLTHPNVLRLYDVWETSKALYLVLEYVEGGELFDLLVERGPLEEQEAVKYFRQIILGTAYCHALGICHRDLKPENLLLDGNLNVKLADFGMAALESNGKLLETSCGSPHYAAPEIVSGLKYHGAASDVWSCGVILYALLTGRLPFDDENIRNLLLKVQAGTFEMPSEISREAQDLIDRMLTVDPMRRIATSDVLQHALLHKYPCPDEDLICVRSLPHPHTAHKSLGSAQNIDKQILENLTILWHHRPESEIVRALLSDGPNPEKTFYALLLRYRHKQDAASDAANDASASKSLPRSTSAQANRVPATPRRSKAQISASSSRHRPVSFQRRYGARGPVANRNSAASSVNNSPYRSPRKSPSRDPRAYAASPSRSSRKRASFLPPAGPLPRVIYNDIGAAAPPSPSYASMPPTLPSKDSIYADSDRSTLPGTATLCEQNQDALAALGAAASIVPIGEVRNNDRTGSGPNSVKRNSMMKSASRSNRRKSVRHSLSTGMKRNSITVKLLSTYAKLASENDWEYMDKETKRTSATFGSLCDKIFNQEAYDEDDEKLIDEEEKRARDYEKLMELERKKHEAELKARKELAKHQRRQSRRSLFSSSRKSHIFVTEDKSENGLLISFGDSDVLPGKRSSQRQAKVSQALRALSEGANENDELTHADVERFKQRSVTQPVPQRRITPLLTRRPVSRLDPLWIAHENEQVMGAQDALEAEFQDTRQRKKNNRESMVSFSHTDTAYDDRRFSKDFRYDGSAFELPERKADDVNLSEEYLSEIRKSRLLNSQSNLNGALKGDSNGSTVKRMSKRYSDKSEDKKTLIGSVNIPTVTRKSRNFTNSNKRLSLLSIKSTRESYQDLNSLLDTHNEDLDEDELNEEEQMTKTFPALRTSFADRLDRVGSSQDLADDDDDEALESASVIDFDEHLANRPTSYYAGSQNDRRKSVMSTKSRRESRPRKSESSDAAKDADYTFADDESRRGANADELFDSIKLPESKNYASQMHNSEQRVRAAQPSVSTMLLPDLNELEQGPANTKTKKYGNLAEPKESKPSVPTHGKGPLVDSTNVQSKAEAISEKRNRSIFRKLSWGTKKSLEEEPQRLPSRTDSHNSANEQKGGLFRRLFSSGDHSQLETHTYKTILPKQEMMTALFALLSSWSNFGLKDLHRDNHSNNILGAVSKKNTLNFKSCRFRIQIAQREMNQKSEIFCSHVKGSAATSKLLFQEIQRVLEKEGVMDA